MHYTVFICKIDIILKPVLTIMYATERVSPVAFLIWESQTVPISHIFLGRSAVAWYGFTYSRDMDTANRNSLNVDTTSIVNVLHTPKRSEPVTISTMHIGTKICFVPRFKYCTSQKMYIHYNKNGFLCRWHRGINNTKKIEEQPVLHMKYMQAHTFYISIYIFQMHAFDILAITAHSTLYQTRNTINYKTHNVTTRTSLTEKILLH